MSFSNDFRTPDELPEHQRKLHRAQMAAERARRELESRAVTDDELRWPGLVSQDQPNEQEQ